MTLKVKATINGTDNYVSTDEINTGTQPYMAEVVSVSGISLKTQAKTGGFLKPSFGKITYTPTLLADDWPPPKSHDIEIKLFDNVIVSGTGQLSGLPIDSVPYTIYGPEYSSELSAGSTTTFFTFMTTSCTTLGLTLDSTNATDYNITFSLSSARLLIDIMSEMSASLCHGFYISGSTLYLLDLAKADGTEIEVDEFSIINTQYTAPVPYSLFRNGDETLSGSFPQGNEYAVQGGYQTSSTDIQTQLSRAKAILDKYVIALKMPLEDVEYKYGQKITFTDTSRINDISVTMWAREFNYTLTTGEEQIIIIGEGTIT